MLIKNPVLNYQVNSGRYVPYVLKGPDEDQDVLKSMLQTLLKYVTVTFLSANSYKLYKNFFSCSF